MIKQFTAVLTDAVLASNTLQLFVGFVVGFVVNSPKFAIYQVIIIRFIIHPTNKETAATRYCAHSI